MKCLKEFGFVPYTLTDNRKFSLSGNRKRKIDDSGCESVPSVSKMLGIKKLRTPSPSAVVCVLRNQNQQVEKEFTNWKTSETVFSCDVCKNSKISRDNIAHILSPSVFEAKQKEFQENGAVLFPPNSICQPCWDFHVQALLTTTVLSDSALQSTSSLNQLENQDSVKSNKPISFSDIQLVKCPSCSQCWWPMGSDYRKQMTLCLGMCPSCRSTQPDAPVQQF
jgi:hypothetical protein